MPLTVAPWFLPMNIVWIGFHEEGLPAFTQIASERHISAFITLSEISFQKRSAGTHGYLQVCREHGIPVHMVDTIKNDESFEIIRDARPDLMVVLGWSEILPDRLLDIPTIGTIGAHAALLPHNRGSAPINWALIHGETVTGNTLMWLSRDVDAGEIIDQMSFPITPFDTCATLYDQVARTNTLMVSRLLEQLDHGIRPSSPIPNQTDEPILPRRRPKDGLITWDQDGQALYDFVRALTHPYPGAFTFLDGQKWVIWEAALCRLDLPLPGACPGEIAGSCTAFSLPVNGLFVAVRDGLLLITELEDEQGTIYRGAQLHDLQLKGVFTNA